jgi:hypothetical protein
MADPSFVDQQLSRQKTDLGITAEQEGAWSSFAETIKAQAQLRSAHRQHWMAGSVPTDQQFAMHQQGLEQMLKVNQATRSLYAALTPEQQAKAGALAGLPGCRRGMF